MSDDLLSNISLPYIPNIFYDPVSIIPKLDEFKKDVVNKAYEISLEQKYVQGKWREPTDKSLEWILDHCQRSEDIRFIHIMPNYSEIERIQIVFMYLPEAWYLAWCNIHLKEKNYFVKKYDLKLL